MSEIHVVRGLLHVSESLLKNIGIKINLDFRKFNQKKLPRIDFHNLLIQNMFIHKNLILKVILFI